MQAALAAVNAVLNSASSGGGGGGNSAHNECDSLVSTMDKVAGLLYLLSISLRSNFKIPGWGGWHGTQISLGWGKHVPFPIARKKSE